MNDNEKRQGEKGEQEEKRELEETAGAKRKRGI